MKQSKLSEHTIKVLGLRSSSAAGLQPAPRDKGTRGSRKRDALQDQQ